MEAIQLEGDVLFGLLKKVSPSMHFMNNPFMCHGRNNCGGNCSSTNHKIESYLWRTLDNFQVFNFRFHIQTYVQTPISFRTFYQNLKRRGQRFWHTFRNKKVQKMEIINCQL